MPDTSSAVASMPGNLNTPLLSGLYADGMPVAALGTALAGVGSSSAPSRFWSTPPRAAADATREVLEVSLGAARTLNSVSLGLPRFPHTSWLQAHDEDTDTWVTLRDAGGNDASVTFSDSLPPVVAAGVNTDGRRHPAHFGAGHWVPITFTFTPISCSRLRLVQVRIPTPAIPVGPTGSAVNYPLGARDLIVGYDTSAPGGQLLRVGPAATATDILGSAVTHTVRRADAWGLPAGRTWRSAPAAVPTAVVSLYADIRDALGDPQVIDRLSMDPITSGVSMCVYYSRDVPIAAGLPAADAPLGAVTVPSPANPTVTASGLRFAGSCWLDIAANAVGFNPSQPFAVGLAFAPAYASTSVTPATLLDAGAFTLSFTTGALTAKLGTLSATVAMSFSSGAPIVAAAVFDGSSLSLTVGSSTATSVAGAPPHVARSASIRLGASQGGSPVPSAMTVTGLMVWQCAPQVAAAGVAAWLTDAAGVLQLPATFTGPAPSDGSVLRLDPALAGQDSPFGVFGAPGIDVGAVRWTPLAVDAVARSGALALQPMLASLIKIEFTNLSPAPFETPDAAPVAMPLSSAARSRPPAPSATGTPDAGTALMSANGSQFFSDMRRLPQPNVQQVSPTEALHAPDPRVAAQINNKPGFGFTPWQSTARPVAPRTAGVHLDAPVEAAIAQRTAFFVALRSLGVGRSGASGVPQDYERVVETMVDGTLLGPVAGAGVWMLQDGRLLTPTPGGGRCVAVSAPYTTHHPIVAVQFAATCSDAVQVIPDADFTAPDLSAWAALGDATLAIGTGYASAVGHTAAITRNGGAVGGVASVATFTPGRTGRLHGAARIYAPTASSAPWRLALVNGDGTVLASSTATPSAGQVLEFTCSLDLDVPLDPGVEHWSVFDGHDTYASMTARGAYGVVSGAGVWVRNVTVQLQQAGVDTDVLAVDSLAIFYDPITWEVSADGGSDWFAVSAIRNDPAGVLLFPASTAPADQLMWRASCDAPGVSISAVALRPWYELRAGGVRPLPPGIPAGPALSPGDHFGPIEDDPMWQAWHNPVPRSWWANGRTAS